MNENDGQLLDKEHEVAFDNRTDNDNMERKGDSGGDDGDDIPLIQKLKLI